ncbi:MAG: glycosyltransferase [candidate division KSB1 bacterium]|nr:glycosyltransferase [candidate division KSB1 bacterium]MDZ7345472.1 glycosyltransferase [candidate division KSB1 bacterium]
MVIAARNEEAVIADCLSALTAQTFPKELTEILVIDDYSTDATVEIASGFAGVTVLKSQPIPGVAPKKAALQTGIEAAKGEIILTTDADCIAPPRWIESMAAAFDDDVDLVASWLLVRDDGRLLSRIERLDSFAYVLIGAALFGLNRPTLANSANLAFRRCAFFEAGGYADIGAFGSGDDDLLVQKMASRSRRQCRFVDGEIVTTAANPRWHDFIAQRLRWASKTAAYPPALKTAEVIIYFYFFLLFISWLCAPSVPFLLIFTAVKFAADFWFLRRIKLPEFAVFLRVFFLAEVIQVLYILAVGLWANLGVYEWKGRTYRRGRLF